MARTAQELTEPGADHSLSANPDAFERISAALRTAGVTANDVASVQLEAMYGLTHSLLAIIDGATKMAEVQRVYLSTDEEGSIGEGLHEFLPEALQLDEHLERLKQSK
ncbi:hypothetical protein FGE12_06645 [Aggregicoccus sp. 17bor-14]|uniref:hypothetical protein n=1 Tax=Myxococcaceae TaxID=31 RepID=UPI00129C9E53|nr:MULTISPECIES: hypothetical protein [Myxococcaceae]MBF5042067.1 hypothetical protein [Simulacricoccus sp. 17bor-14]MRI87845.1 hypothetical protein [Aggregicoccus sp. 17bor-14]